MKVRLLVGQRPDWPTSQFCIWHLNTNVTVFVLQYYWITHMQKCHLRNQAVYGKLKYFHSPPFQSVSACSFIYWLPLTDSKFSFLQLLKLPKCSHATTSTILLVFLPFVSATTALVPVTSSLCRGFQGWQRNKHFKLYSGLQRHGTIPLALKLLSLQLRAEGLADDQSLVSFIDAFELLCIATE